MNRRLFRELKAELEPLGFRFVGINHNNHLAWRHPKMATPLITVARPGCRRTKHNVITQARRLVRAAS